VTIKHATTGLGTEVTTTIWEETHSIEGDIIPETTTTYDLGSASKIWAEVHAKYLKSITEIRPTASESVEFWSFNGSYRIVLGGLDGTAFYFRPYTNDTGKLGHASYKWGDIYCTTLHADTVSTGKVLSKTMFFNIDGKDYTPGDTNWHAIDETQAKVANDYFKPSYARIVARVNADEAGAKYLKITDGAADVAEVTWSGAAAATIASAWTAYTDTTDRTMKVEYKASSNTETVTLYNVAFEMR